MTRIPDLRAVARAAGDLGIPAPGLMVSLAYYDAYRNARLPTNLIQAQRDYFGAHGYERIDLPGNFHTVWIRD
jgi:6-phosphogluconate dehydrogenase